MTAAARRIRPDRFPRADWADAQHRTIRQRHNVRAEPIGLLIAYLRGSYDGNSFNEGGYKKEAQENCHSIKSKSLRYSLRQGIHRMSRGRR
jgi:hypothetical protein